MPITIDSPRDFPLEVRYRPHHNRPVGIDLYWVTPDSPRDAEGRPIASVVPAEALFVDPPGPMDRGETRSENSMISSEFLYFSPATQGDAFTLTIRLADENGRPVAGKRVHVSGLVSYGQADIITQPEKPTDENGVTTARVRAGPGYRARHESTFHAADVTALPGGGDEDRPLVHEVKAGEHCRVQLGPGEEMRIASVLVPVGPLGPNTTARWAVEGMIGNELIGGMMHEMHVPAVLEDLEIPIQPATVHQPAAVRQRGWMWAPLTVAAAVALVACIVGVLMARRRRGGSAT